MGQFTQEDPIGLAGGLNLYGYANGDPVNFADPFGLMAEDCCDPRPILYSKLRGAADAVLDLYDNTIGRLTVSAGGSLGTMSGSVGSDLSGNSSMGGAITPRPAAGERLSGSITVGLRLQSPEGEVQPVPVRFGRGAGGVVVFGVSKDEVKVLFGGFFVGKGKNAPRFDPRIQFESVGPHVPLSHRVPN